jgi:hypothetical protein
MQSVALMKSIRRGQQVMFGPKLTRWVRTRATRLRPGGPSTADIPRRPQRARWPRCCHCLPHTVIAAESTNCAGGPSNCSTHPTPGNRCRSEVMAVECFGHDGVGGSTPLRLGGRKHARGGQALALASRFACADRTMLRGRDRQPHPVGGHPVAQPIVPGRLMLALGAAATGVEVDGASTRRQDLRSSWSAWVCQCVRLPQEHGHSSPDDGGDR